MKGGVAFDARRSELWNARFSHPQFPLSRGRAARGCLHVTAMVLQLVHDHDRPWVVTFERCSAAMPVLSGRASAAGWAHTGVYPLSPRVCAILARSSGTHKARGWRTTSVHSRAQYGGGFTRLLVGRHFF